MRWWGEHVMTVRIACAEFCCRISHEMSQIKQLLQICILSQSPYPESSLTVTPSWLNFTLLNSCTSSKTVLPASTLTSTKILSSHPLPCSLHWLLMLKSKILMVKELPQTCRPGQPSSPALHGLDVWLLAAFSSCTAATWTPAWPEFSPSQFPNAGLNFPPTSGHTITPWLLL